MSFFLQDEQSGLAWCFCTVGEPLVRPLIYFIDIIMTLSVTLGLFLNFLVLPVCRRFFQFTSNNESLNQMIKLRNILKSEEEAVKQSLVENEAKPIEHKAISHQTEYVALNVKSDEKYITSEISEISMDTLVADGVKDLEHTLIVDRVEDLEHILVADRVEDLEHTLIVDRVEDLEHILVADRVKNLEHTLVAVTVEDLEHTLVVDGVEDLEHILIADRVEDSEHTLVVDRVEDLEHSLVADRVEDLEHTLVVDGVEDLEHTLVVDGVEDLEHTLVLDGVEDLEHTLIIDKIEDLEHTLVVDKIEDLEHTLVVNRVEDLEHSLVADRVEDLQHTLVVYKIEDLEHTLVADTVKDLEHSLLVDKIEDLKHTSVANRLEDLEHTEVTDGVEDLEHTEVTDGVEDLEHTVVTDGVEDLEHTEVADGVEDLEPTEVSDRVEVLEQTLIVGETKNLEHILSFDENEILEHTLHVYDDDPRAVNITLGENYVTGQELLTSTVVKPGIRRVSLVEEISILNGAGTFEKSANVSHVSNNHIKETVYVEENPVFNALAETKATYVAHEDNLSMLNVQAEVSNSTVIEDNLVNLAKTFVNDILEKSRNIVLNEDASSPVCVKTEVSNSSLLNSESNFEICKVEEDFLVELAKKLVKGVLQDSRDIVIERFAHEAQVVAVENSGNELEHALRNIGRSDVVKSCMRNIEMVTEDSEKMIAQEIIGSQDELIVPKNESFEESCSSRLSSTSNVFQSKSADDVFEEQVQIKLDNRRGNGKAFTSLEEQDVTRRREEGLLELLEALDISDRQDILASESSKISNYEIDQTFGTSRKQPSTDTSQYQDFFERLEKSNPCFSAAPEMELLDEVDH